MVAARNLKSEVNVYEVRTQLLSGSEAQRYDIVIFVL